MWVAHFDGDDVGPGLEILLLDNRLEDARVYSRRIVQAMTRLSETIRESANSDIVVSGGDDLIVSWQTAPDSNWLESLRATFREDCGRTLSIGLGQTPRTAADNLRRAKLEGKDRLVREVNR